MTAARPRLLLVDDEPMVLDGLVRVLARLAREFAVETATSGEAALERLEDGDWAMVVSDQRMTGISGTEVLMSAARRWPHVPRILLTGSAEATTVIEALSPAHRFLCKPCSALRLTAAVRELHGHVTATSLRVAGVVALAIEESTLADTRRALTAGPVALERVVSDHPALALAALHAVGSEFLGMRTPAGSVKEALQLLGTAGFARVLDSRCLLAIPDAASAWVRTAVELGRERRRAAPPDEPLAQLAGLLGGVDRLGSCSADGWTPCGPRAPGGAAALAGMWGAESAIVDAITAAEDAS